MTTYTRTERAENLQHESEIVGGNGNHHGERPHSHGYSVVTGRCGWPLGEERLEHGDVYYVSSDVHCHRVREELR